MDDDMRDSAVPVHDGDVWHAHVEATDQVECGAEVAIEWTSPELLARDYAIAFENMILPAHEWGSLPGADLVPVLGTMCRECWAPRARWAAGR